MEQDDRSVRVHLLAQCCIAIVNHDQADAASNLVEQAFADDPSRAAVVSWLVLHNGGGSPPAPRVAVPVVPIANQGYGAAINHAFRETDCRWIVACNADLIFSADFLVSLENLLATWSTSTCEQLAVVGVKTLSCDGHFEPSIGPFPSLWRFLVGLTRPRTTRKVWRHAADQSLSSIPWVTGACLVIDRHAWQTVGGFDEGFFLYYEEVDFCLRLHQAGFRVAYEPTLTVSHLSPYHARPQTYRTVLAARHSLYRYFLRHRPAWEVLIIRLVIRCEAWRYFHDPVWRAIAARLEQAFTQGLDNRLTAEEIARLTPAVANH